jgi:soluble lytic murein transglycosylase-like protein
MQISYQTARAVGFKGHPKDLMNWKINLKYAAKYLELLIPKHITLRRVIASYNAGTVYLCRKRCPPGQFVNEGYVTSVMEVYTSLKNVATE